MIGRLKKRVGTPPSAMAVAMEVEQRMSRCRAQCLQSSCPFLRADGDVRTRATP